MQHSCNDHPHAGHAHTHTHTHTHAPANFGRAFAIGLGLNAAYVAVQVAAGLRAHSVALLADAGHNLGDVAGLGSAWLAAFLSTRAPRGSYTYGFRRSTIMVALANAIVLLVITGAIAWSSLLRLIAPQQSGGRMMCAVALGGVAVNAAAAALFARGRKTDLNLRAAFAHLAADALLALGVAAAGAVIAFTGWRRVDPAVSLVLSAIIVAATWRLLREAVDLSLDAVPRGVDRAAVETYLRTLPGVAEVHDLHIWAISTTETALTAHLVRADPGLDATLLSRLAREVREAFNIGHATVQFETPSVAHGCDLRGGDTV